MSFFGIFFSSVPRLFWSEYSGEPFLKCLACKVPLMESNMHVVKKKIVGNEAVLEMALCNRCQQKQVEEMSEETRNNLTAYMAEHFRESVESHMPQSDGPQVIEVTEVTDEEEGRELLNRCTDHCMICGIARNECHRYALAGVCKESQLVVQITPVGQTPMMVCEKCELEMDGLISQETRDSWDKFMEEHMDGPPGAEIDSPSTYPVSF